VVIGEEENTDAQEEGGKGQELLKGGVGGR